MSRLPVVLILFAFGCKVSKNEWIEQFEPKMIDELCKPTQYFRTCYDVDEATCRSLTKVALKDCIAKATLPDEFDKQAGAKAGGEIGECTGGAIEVKLQADKRTFYAEKHVCVDPDAWRGK